MNDWVRALFWALIVACIVMIVVLWVITSGGIK
jgi:hypothetical protein